MTHDIDEEMERDCIARILKKICEQQNLQAQDIFEEAALEAASNRDMKEKTDELLQKLCLS